MTDITKNRNSVDEKEADIEDALEATGFGKFHVWITIASGLIINAVNSEAWSIGYVIPSAECDLNLDLKQKTILVTVGAVGITTTQFFWGYLSDKLGRRNILMYTQIAALLCTVCSVLAPMFWLVALFRFLNGAFVAGAAGLSFAYIGEFFAEKYRSVAILVMSTFIGFALMAIPAAAWLIIPYGFPSMLGYSVASWRVFVLIAGLPSLSAIIALYFSPESPKFLLLARRHDEALQVLRKMHKTNGNTNEFLIKKLSDDECGNESAHIWDMFNRKYALNTFLVCAVQAGVFATSGGLFLWYPDILQRISQSNEDITVCRAIDMPRNVSGTNGTLNNYDNECTVDINSSVYVQNIFIGAAYTIGYFVNSALVSKVGVKNILIAFLGMAGCATFALQFMTNKTAIDVLFLALMVLSGLCVVVVSAAVVEIYPTNLRGMAVCMTMLSGRLATIVTSSVVGYSLLWNCEATFMMFAASLIGSSLLSLLLPSKATPR